MINAYIGQIMLFAGDYVIEGWYPCDGSELKIQEFEALYSVLGTTYGGDGKKTFCVPDLRDKFPRQSPGYSGGVHAAKMGQTGGVSEYPAVDMSYSFHIALPKHTHTVHFDPGTVSVDQVKIQVVSGNAGADTTTNKSTPKDSLLAQTFAGAGATPLKTYSSAPPDAVLGGVIGGQTGTIKDASVFLEPAGSLVPSTETHTGTDLIKVPIVIPARTNNPPFLTMNYLICIEGGEYPPKLVK